MNRLRELRKQAGIDVATLAASMSVSEDTIASWEMGRRGIRTERAHKLIAVLKTHGVYATLDALLPPPRI